MSFGITIEGFIPKTVEDAKAELEASFRAAFGESIDVSPQSNFGQIIGVMAENIGDAWDALHGVYAAFAPDSAGGISLDNVAAITGTVREPATPSEVTITATGTAGTVLTAGRQMSVTGTGVKFETTAGGTIAAVGAWASGTAYTLGQRRSNSGNVYQVTTAGTSAGSGGPTGTGSAITDNTVVWQYLGAGAGAVDITAESVDYGPKVALAGTLINIETPVSGWSNVTNLLDAEVGADLETDASLRVRREQELRASGNAALEAIRSAILQVEDVETCTVFENITDDTDVDGLPPHSVEVLVKGGEDEQIAAELFGSVAAGIATYGTTTETVSDVEGLTHTIKFSRPSDVDIWVIVNVTADEDAFPSDGDTQIRDAIVEYGEAQRTGKDVVAAALVAQVFKVAGVLDVECLIGLSSPPVASTTLPINLRELAVFDTSRITINVTYGSP